MKKIKKVLKQDKKAVKEETFEEDLKRIQADFINYRNRVEKEKEAFAEYKLESFVTKLLDVIDNLELTLKHLKTENEDVKKGIEIIRKQFLDTLEKEGIVKIINDGEFNPEIHEVIEKIKGEKENRIVEVVQNGYMLNNKVIRPSKVKITGEK